MKVLVTGATGFVGSHLVPVLVDAGYQVTCLVRPTSNTTGLESLDVKLVAGDVTDPDVLRNAVASANAVVHLAGIAVPDLEECERVNVGGVQALIDACREKGVRRVIANSTVSATREHLGAYGLTKRQGEELWRASGLDVTILRFSLVYGRDERGVFGRMVQLVTAFPFVPVVGPGTYEVQPVHVDDVCQAILRCLAEPVSVGKTYALAGRGTTTFSQLVDAILLETGRRSRKIHIPVPIALLMARAMALVMPNPPLSVDNILGMNQPTDYDISAAEGDLGFDPRPLSEGIAQALGETAASHPGTRRIAVVGLGRMGLAHAALLNTIPNAHLVGLCDRQARLGKQARGMGLRVPFYTDFEQMLAELRPDGVLICTPPNSHLPLARMCLEREVAVFLEKPLAESLASAQQMVELLAEHPVVNAIGYQYTHVPIYQRGQRLLRDGIVGRPLTVRASMYLGQVLEPKKASWWYDPAVAGGGVVISITSHLLMLLIRYFGQVEWVEAETRRVHSTAVEDEATIRLGFAGGLEAMVETSWSAPGYEQSAIEIDVEAEGGTLKVTDAAIELDLHQPSAGFSAGETRILASEIPDPASFELGTPGLWAEDAEFVDSLVDGCGPAITWQDGLAVQQIVDAVYRSALDNRRVVLYAQAG